MLSKLNKFKVLSVVSSILFLWLFAMLMFDCNTFLEDVGLNGNETTSILGRRTAMLMLGFAVLLFFGSRASHSAARQAIALGTAVTMLGLASMGTFELVRGSMGTAILQAVAVESIVAVCFFWLWLAHRNVNFPTPRGRGASPQE